MASVAVIYDTSYLMTGRGLLHEACEPLRQCSVTNILPQEVEEEIKRYFEAGAPEEDPRARVARKRIATLIGLSGPSMPFRKVRLGEAAPPATGDQVLGADPRTDRLLIDYGRRLLQDREFSAVVIASDDEGIQLDVNRLRLNSGLQFFFISDPGDAHEVDPLWEAPAFGRAGPLAPPVAILEGHDQFVEYLGFDSFGRSLVSASLDRTINAWSVPDGRLLATVKLPGGSMAFGSPEAKSFAGIRFSPNAHMFARPAPRGIEIYSMSDLRLLRTIQGAEPGVFALSTDGWGLATTVPASRRNNQRSIVEVFHIYEGNVRSWFEFDPRQSSHWGIWKERAMDVTALAFDQDGRVLATGHNDGSVFLLDVPNHRVLAQLDQRRGGTIRSLDFSPDNQFLVARNDFNGVRIWSAAGGEPLATPGVPNHIYGDVSFSLDGDLLAVPGFINISVEALEGSVTVLEVPAGRPVATLPVLADACVFGVERTLVTANARQVQVWDIVSGEMILSHEVRPLMRPALGPYPCRYFATANKNRVRGGQFLGYDDFHVRLHEVVPGDPARERSGSSLDSPVQDRPAAATTRSADPGVPLATDRPPAADPVKPASASSDLAGARSAPARQPVPLSEAALLGSPPLRAFWRLKQLWQARVVEAAPNPAAAEPPAIEPTPPPRGTPAAPVGELRRFEGHNGWVHSVAFSPDGRYALSGGEDDSAMRLWDVQTGQQVRFFEGHESKGYKYIKGVAFAPDGRRALSGGAGSIIRLWDIEDGHELRRFEAMELKSGTCVWCVAFAPDGRRILSGDDDFLRLWDVESGRELRRFAGQSDPFALRGIGFAPDGRRALSGGMDQAAWLWDLEGGRALRRFQGHTDWVMSVAFAPDGLRALSGSHDHTVRLWDVATGRELRRFAGHTAGVMGVAFAPNGRRALSCSLDRTARLWDVATGRELLRFEGHTDTVRCVAFAPDGRSALSGSYDRTLRLWGLPD